MSTQAETIQAPIISPIVREATPEDGEDCGRIFYDAFESIATRHNLPIEPSSREFTRYMVGQMLGAAVIVEIVFGLPGIGTALIDAVLGRDYPVVQGIVLVFGMLVVVVNFVADSVGGWLDPRTRTA